MRAVVAAFMEQLAGKSLSHLLLLKTNAGYLESILSRVELERSVQLKYQNLGNLSKVRVADAEYENGVLAEQLDMLREQCRILKAQIESCISKSFADRQVRLIGEIGTI